jgi:predicted PurR-regulated permease PerM
VLRAAALVTAMYVLLRLVWFANQLFFIAFLGVLFGLAAAEGVDRLAKRGVIRGLGAALVVFGTLGLLVGVGAWMAPVLVDQSQELRTKLPQAIDEIDAYLEDHRDGILGLLLRPEDASDSAAAAQQTAPVLPAAGRRVDTNAVGVADTSGAAIGAIDRTVPVMRADTTLARVGAAPPSESRLRRALRLQIGSAKGYLFPFLTSTATVFAGFLIVIFVTIYVATEPDLYHRGLMHLFPHRSRERAGQVLSAMSYALRRWLITQLIAMLSIGAVTTLALLILHVPAAVPLGIIAGLMEFIPTIGPIISAVPAIAMGFIDSPEKALWVAIAYTIVQQLEGHLLIPLLMKEGVNLPPVLTILAQALMALVFGILGLLVAVPLLAASVVAVKLLYVEDVVGDPIELPGEEYAET